MIVPPRLSLFPAIRRWLSTTTLRQPSLFNHPRHHRHIKGNYTTTSSSFSTYYDSQSGLHIPIHNEDEIILIVDKSGSNNYNHNNHKDSSNNHNNHNFNNDPFLPPQLYKEDARSSDMPDKLQELVQRGIHGIRVNAVTFPRDVRNLKILSAIAPSPQFVIFVPITANSQPIPATLPYISAMYNYQDLMIQQKGNTTTTTKIHEQQQQQQQHKQQQQQHTTTTIVFGPDECTNTSTEPITVANQVATLIDKYQLGDYLWLSPNGNNNHNNNTNNNVDDVDNVIRLYEELIYLDVAGPTIKSRLIMETSNEELIEEAMMSGINKFVIPTSTSSSMNDDNDDNDNDDNDASHEEKVIKMTTEIAEELGKRILRVE